MMCERGRGVGNRTKQKQRGGKKRSHSMRYAPEDDAKYMRRDKMSLQDSLSIKANWQEMTARAGRCT